MHDLRSATRAEAAGAVGPASAPSQPCRGHRSTGPRFFVPLVISVTGAALLGIALPMAEAESLNVNPTRIELTRQDPTGLLELRNLSDRPMTLQLEVVEWTQDSAGQDLEQPTDELVVYPTLFDLEAHSERTIRLGLEQPSPVDRERSFRIYTRQLPTVEDAVPNTLSVMLRIGVPVFYLPNELDHSVTLESALSGCEARLHLANDGSVHLDPQDVTVRLSDGVGGQVHTVSSRSWYLLPGARRDLSIAIAEGPCAAACKIEVDVVAGPTRIQAADDSACRTLPSAAPGAASARTAPSETLAKNGERLAPPAPTGEPTARP